MPGMARRRACPAARRSWAEQVDPARGHLPGRADQRGRAGGGEVARPQLGRGEPRDGRGVGGVAHPGGRVAAAVAPDEPPLDGGGLLAGDELLAHGPHQGLERHGPPVGAHVGRRADRRADDGVGAESVGERPQVIVDRRPEAGARHPGLGGGGVARLGAQAHVAARVPGAQQHRVAADVDQALQAAVAAPGQPVPPEARQADGPHRGHLVVERHARIMPRPATAPPGGGGSRAAPASPRPPARRRRAG